MVTKDTVRRAYLTAVALGARAPVLVGTAALLMHGFAVEPDDIDFLVAPEGGGIGEQYPESEKHEVAGATLHLIEVRDPERRHWYNPGLLFIDGIPVATVVDVIALKRWKGRAKDVDFLRGWDAWANMEKVT